MRSRTRYYGPTSHRRVGRKVKGGNGFRARVGNMYELRWRLRQVGEA
jgi:hypothetical protein